MMIFMTFFKDFTALHTYGYIYGTFYFILSNKRTKKAINFYHIEHNYLPRHKEAVKYTRFGLFLSLTNTLIFQSETAT